MRSRSTLAAQLRRDHRLLKMHLTVMTSAASMTPETWLVLRNEYLAVAKRLRDHVRREVAAGGAVSEDPSGQIVRHDDRLRSLQLLGRFFVDGYPLGPLHGIQEALTAVAEGLREEIRLQDAEWLPELERRLDSQSAIAAPGNEEALDPEMTVERVLLDYPQTRPVFDRLFVSEAFEAYDCLDEVAWRHGLSVEALLSDLQRSLAPAPARYRPPSSLPC